MKVLYCDRCLLEFLDYIGYKEVAGEGIVCMECIYEAEDEEVSREKLEKRDAQKG